MIKVYYISSNTVQILIYKYQHRNNVTGRKYRLPLQKFFLSSLLIFLMLEKNRLHIRMGKILIKYVMEKPSKQNLIFTGTYFFPDIGSLYEWQYQNEDQKFIT